MMKYNEEFAKRLENDKEYNKYMNSNWATINSMRGKITINKAAFIGCAAVAGYSALNLAAIIIRPEYSLISFDGLKYALMGGLTAKAGYGFFKKMKTEKEDVNLKAKTIK